MCVICVNYVNIHIYYVILFFLVRLQHANYSLIYGTLTAYQVPERPLTEGKGMRTSHSSHAQQLQKWANNRLRHEGASGRIL